MPNAFSVAGSKCLCKAEEETIRVRLPGASRNGLLVVEGMLALAADPFVETGQAKCLHEGWSGPYIARALF
jgi:hypothetical protein